MALFLAALLTGCAAVSDLNIGRSIEAPPEYKQEKVGLFVHEEAETFYYPGTTTQDVTDLVSVHLTQVLPFSTQSALQELFKAVELSESGPKIVFKSEELPGYFEVKIASVRYDWPDPQASRYRADVQLAVEFKTMRGEVVWNRILKGSGLGFNDPNIRLTRFGRDAATALEDAFQNAVYEMQEAVQESPTLREYFQWLQAKKPAPPAAQPPSSSHP